MARKQPPKDMLRVLPNPFRFGGNPMCACASDPTPEVDFPRRYIGARPIVRSIGESVTVGKYRGVIGDEQHEVEWEFSSEVQSIPNTGYYRSVLKDGALVPADAETAAKAGLKFTSVEQMLARDPDAPMQPTRKGQG
jgi:hypothetical protein